MKKFIVIPIMMMGCLAPRDLPRRVELNPDKFVKTVLIDLRWNGQNAKEPWKVPMRIGESFFDPQGIELRLVRDPEDPERFWLEEVK